MSDARQRLERLLGGELLEPLRRRLRQRYELGRVNGIISLSEVSGAERRALEGLLARPARDARSIRFSVAEADAALARAGLADSLCDALAQLDGPIHNRAAARVAHVTRWRAVFAACSNPQLAALLDTSAGRGLVKRLAASNPDRGCVLLESAAQVIERLPQCGIPLSRLAAEALADAHGLDEGRPVSTLTLAALREGDAERPREVWARHGVLVGELAAPALALNLVANRETSGGVLVEEARMLGEPVHLSLRALLRAPPRWKLRDRVVRVCENPAVVAMAADRLGTCGGALVCTDGMPSAAQRTLLSQLAAAGALLRYHGDFDWPGIAIGNFMMRTFGAQPWRFGSADYAMRALHAGRSLGTPPVSADWDADLSRTMCKCGYALEEEAVIDLLLEDLATS